MTNKTVSTFFGSLPVNRLENEAEWLFC